VNVRRSTNGSHLNPLPTGTESVSARSILHEEAFLQMIVIERKRTERSRKPFLLMLLDTGENMPSEKSGKTLGKILFALSEATRETDVTGWYKNDCVVGVMFTEITGNEQASLLSTIISRVSETLRDHLNLEQFSQISISFHVFPEDWDQEFRKRLNDPILYPDLSARANSKRLLCAMKRVMDVAGSLLALMLFSPLFLAIAAAIKATSKGPILFCQRRVGQYGEAFTLLKFRSMDVDNDARVHQEYVKQLIAGKAEKQPSNGNGDGHFKLTRDPRITPVGSFLRKTSLDELPQFINVFTGDMSMVGPRPPIPYEVESYDYWHRRRLLEVKPGITGLWQVSGRSRVKFDDMVRLDLRYARTWSPWMDIKILLRTPGAMVSGEGAY
jgi:lipopolysaccharide/colanic/teichoic acid biosynthesis glycosyltransferase